MKAIHVTAYGDAREVLQVVDLEPPTAPGVGEVLIDMEYAPLNKHDLASISGFLPVPPAPFVAGNEGTGVVAATGEGVTNVKPGDRVALPLLSGTWREQIVVPAVGMAALPEADPQQLAMIGSNPPTAALILDKYADVPAGSYVVQNAANSGVGRSLIAIAAPAASGPSTSRATRPPSRN
ncbi:alcohol dehydrogenase catalytic domain-containing protein [Streptomyces sp. NPDC026672]|uniref:alcohol dehydrogenase catalytic domain-containing protein n=1 Tax=unclassified Streptomyces TaxID=2593676 RepID=UPI0033FFA767